MLKSPGGNYGMGGANLIVEKAWTDQLSPFSFGVVISDRNHSARRPSDMTPDATASIVLTIPRLWPSLRNRSDQGMFGNHVGRAFVAVEKPTTVA